MLFNTLQFGVFFLVVWGLYAALPHRRQNLLLLGASYIFYAAWDWRFLSLILISTLVDFLCAEGIHASQRAPTRKALLAVSACTNLGLLGVFKYFDFFAGSLLHLLDQVGLSLAIQPLQVVLPVGISFYTFQSLGYTVDVYRGRVRPPESLVDFALFVAFFPQLVAGPIERAERLLPQICSPREVRAQWVRRGCFLIFLGLFQKNFVADNLSAYVDTVFSAPLPPEGLAVLLALYCFAFQIYCDFAGYSNIARGLASVLGIRLVNNFDAPYLASNPRQFWGRWHISLSTWLRDYLYIPLGGSRAGPWRTGRNLALTMVLGGLWHGAGWTFILWGAYHGLLLASHRLLASLRRDTPPATPWMVRAQAVLGPLVFFHLVCLGWLLFRAESLQQVGQMLAALGTAPFVPLPEELDMLRGLCFYGLPVIFLDLAQHRTADPCAPLKLPLAARVVLYLLMFYAMVIWGADDAQKFIYFQF